VARNRRADDLSVQELRQLLIEKSRGARQARLAHYRRTGRVVNLQPQVYGTPIEALRSAPLPADEINRRPRRRSGLDRVLLMVEILAVIGLLVVLFNGFNVLQTLNREVSAAISLPTITPTPAISAVVLPGGHTPPNARGETEFNISEIPEHLRPLVNVLASLPIPTPSPEQAFSIKIPAIGVEATIIQGDRPEQLNKGVVGQSIGSANPGQKGNLVLSAHNDVYGEIFRHLDKLKKGDEIIIFTQLRSYTYVVQGTQIVQPSAVEVMDATIDPVVTLISCYPYLVDKQRIVVTAILQE
jgi:sortase A